MTAHSQLRGHTIERRNGLWVYADTGEPTAGSKRPCGRCHKQSTAEGHDACLGTLAGVMNACCGHGDDRMAYVQMNGGSTLRGPDALEFFADVLRRTEGERAPGYKSQITETKHWAFAEVVENHPLCDDPKNQMIGNRSLLLLSNTDNGKTGWHSYGPRDLAVGTRVELFMFRVHRDLLTDFRVLKETT